MIRKKPIVTFVGAKQAREGLAFIHKGGSPECKDCKYYQICVGKLEAGRVYRVVKLYERVFPCKLHEAGVKVVGVVESDITATIPSRLAMEGAVVTFLRQECDMQNCEHHEYCAPLGLADKDRCAIVEVKENVSCPRGLSLVRVALRRLPAS